MKTTDDDREARVHEARNEVETLVREMLTATHWMTIGEVAYDLRTNYGLRSLELRVASPRKVYGWVRSVVERMHRRGEVERCLGADDGREVRVYRSTASACA